MNVAEFAKECLQVAFEGCGLDGGDIQDLAVKHGLIEQVAFDPSKHYDPEGVTEDGDQWFAYTDGFKAALTGAPASAAEPVWQEAIDITRDYQQDAEPDGPYWQACEDLIERFREKVTS